MWLCVYVTEMGSSLLKSALKKQQNVHSVPLDFLNYKYQVAQRRLNIGLVAISIYNIFRRKSPEQFRINLVCRLLRALISCVFLKQANWDQ